jgi:hypothetical protein
MLIHQLRRLQENSSDDEDTFSDVTDDDHPEISGDEIFSEKKAIINDEKGISEDEIINDEKILCETFHPGVENVIFDYLGYDISLSQKAYPFHQFMLFKNQNSLPLIACRYLLWGGNPLILKKLIIDNKYLLDLDIIGSDPVGRKRERTLYQHALAVGDFGMINMLKKLLLAYRGEQEEEIQRKKQFPSEWKKIASTKLNKDVNALDSLILTITDAKSRTYELLEKECQSDILNFKKFIIESDTVAGIGRDFDMHFLALAAERLKENTIEMSNMWGRKKIKADLYCKQVFGFLQRRVPTREAHYMIYGIYNIIKEYKNIFFEESDEEIPRTLIFGNNSYYYNEFPLRKVLGEGYFVTDLGDRSWMMFERSVIRDMAENLKKYADMKYRQYENLSKGHESYYQLLG